MGKLFFTMAWLRLFSRCFGHRIRLMLFEKPRSFDTQKKHVCLIHFTQVCNVMEGKFRAENDVEIDGCNCVVTASEYNWSSSWQTFLSPMWMLYLIDHMLWWYQKVSALYDVFNIGYCYNSESVQCWLSALSWHSFLMKNEIYRNDRSNIRIDSDLPFMSERRLNFGRNVSNN